MAEITLVKGEISALDRTWMSMPDGSTRQVAVHVVHDVAKAATNAVANRWQDGPDTPDGVRARLRPGEEADADYRQRVASLLGRLDDGTIALAISGTRDLAAAWARLPAGGIMRLEWPLPRAALGS